MKTALDRFMAAHTVVRGGEEGLDRKAQFFLDQSPKQQIQILLEEKFLSQIQARAVAVAVDAAARDGKDPRKACEKALKHVAQGKLKLGRTVDRKAKKAVVTLSDIRAREDSFGEKQQLLELREAGSLAPKLVRKCANLMAQGRSLVQALVAVDHAHLLGDEIPVPADPKEEEPDAGSDRGPEEEDGEGSPEGEGPPEVGEEEGQDGDVQPSEAEGGDPTPDAGDAEGDAPAPKPPRTIAQVSGLPIPELEEAVAKIKHSAPILELLILERDKTRPRKGALEVIHDRLDELGVGEAEIEGALKTAGQEHDGDPAEDFDEE